MHTKTTRHATAERARNFEITVVSSPDGYVARVHEQLPSGERVPIALSGKPAFYIHPSTFYPARRHYRGELVGQIKAILNCGVISRLDQLDQGENIADYDSYIRANLIGWPDAYPEVVDDDMADWADATN